MVSCEIAPPQTVRAGSVSCAGNFTTSYMPRLASWRGSARQRVRYRVSELLRTRSRQTGTGHRRLLAKCRRPERCSALNGRVSPRLGSVALKQPTNIGERDASNCASSSGMRVTARPRSCAQLCSIDGRHALKPQPAFAGPTCRRAARRATICGSALPRTAQRVQG